MSMLQMEGRKKVSCKLTFFLLLRERDKLTMYILQVVFRSFLIPSLASLLFFLAWRYNTFALISDHFIVQSLLQ